MLTSISVLLIASSSFGLQTAAELSPGLYMTTMEATPIRTGPGSDYYAFMTAPAGTPIQVTETMDTGWARVPAVGPAFRNTVGIIRYPTSESGRFELRSDGTGRANGRLEILAPNPNSDAWGETFGWVCLLQSGDVVQVLNSGIASAETTGRGEYQVHQVALPAASEVWINASMLKPASATASAAFEQRDTTAPTWVQIQPASPLSNWNNWSLIRDDWIASKQAPVVEEVAAIEPVAESTEVVVIEEPAPEPAYQNKQWEALEATITATPLHRLDAKAVEQLRAGYVQVVDTESTAHPEIAELATFRLRQLELARTLNATRADIASAKKRIERSRSELNAQKSLLDESPDYVLRGRLTISPVFDGVDRPIYYRLQDPFSGRSLAYLSPDSDVDVRGMLGQRVGIVGRLIWDQEWQVTTVEPERIDLVSVTPPQ
ncbi:MAG: hypothetical protein MK077_00405 [Phycisphaerales bacterium]|nr:hypothetical protein [Phycisphaerales bacterium]